MSKKGSKDKKQSTPVLARVQTNRNQWENNSPRLTNEQQQILLDITRGVYEKLNKQNINRKTFIRVHEDLEDELTTKVAEQLNLKAGIEWKGIFPDHVSKYFNSNGLPNSGYVEGILPTVDFLESEIFDYIEVFQPRVVLFQFEDYNSYMKSAEEAIDKAEKRREKGDRYFSEQEKHLNYRPNQLPGQAEDTLDQEENG